MRHLSELGNDNAHAELRTGTPGARGYGPQANRVSRQC